MHAAPAALLTFVILAARPAHADDRKAGDLDEGEQRNIARFCAIAHRPGAALRACIQEQTDKVVQGKQAQQNNQRMEDLTTQQIGK